MLAALVFFQNANAQLGVGAVTHAAVTATVNTTKATTAIMNATHRVTAATTHAVRSSTQAVAQATRASIQSARKMKTATRVNADADLSVKNNTQTSSNSNTGGEDKGLVRAASVSEADAHANVNATLPMKEAKDDMTETTDGLKDKTEKTKAAAIHAGSQAKEKAGSVKNSSSVKTEATASSTVKSGK